MLLFFTNALDSMMKKNFANHENIFIDDGSTDVSGEKFKKYKKDTLVKVIY